MAKDNNKSISLPQIKELEKYCDLVKDKKISELEIETNDIRLKIISDNKKSTQRGQFVPLCSLWKSFATWHFVMLTN